MDKSLHVFVCSTYRDLVSERNAVSDGLDGLGDQFPDFTYYCPRSIQTLDSAKEEIRRSDVLVMIVGHLQGVIAPGLDISHGEAEYNEGAAQGKTVLVYLRDAKSGLYPAHFERDPARAQQLKAFREKLESHHGAKVFDDIYSLVSLVTQDLFRLAQEKGMETKSGPKTTKFRAKSWESRRMHVLNGSAATTQEKTGSTEDLQTRTIPMLQKALSTPFQRRRASNVPMGKTLTLALVIIAVAGFALAKLKALPFAKITHQPIQSVAGANNGGSAIPPSTARPAAGNEETEAAPPPAPARPPRASGSVAVTDDEDSTKAFLRKAIDGSPEDQFQVGIMYEQGKDLPRNDSMAFRWYKKAAEKGYAESQYKIALMYRTGKGTAKSAYQAARWFQAAAEQGHAKAQVKLGQMYKTGKGVERNESTAFKWFLKAADQKDPDAEKILAELKEN
ncbi:MAG: Sel1 domain protein repeat-containing protein [Fibrobacteres bacterium]|nr:Sel1 domain protein repeat-containing protein [Fibrobacterota bacterium]